MVVLCSLTFEEFSFGGTRRVDVGGSCMGGAKSPQFGGVNETLEDAVHVASVAQVVKPSGAFSVNGQASESSAETRTAAAATTDAPRPNAAIHPLQRSTTGGPAQSKFSRRRLQQIKSRLS